MEKKTDNWFSCDTVKAYGTRRTSLAAINVPTGIPLVYELDEELHPIRHYYLGDESEIQNAIQAVANQASVKHQ